jgi:hypothetical protein
VNQTSWTSSDLEQMKGLGISPAEVERQLTLFRHPPPYTELIKPAAVGDGIYSIPPQEQPELLDFYEKARREGRLRKFVPASGAATRMFQTLIKFHQNHWTHRDMLKTRAAEKDQEAASLLTFMDSLSQMAFYGDLNKRMDEKGLSLEALLRGGRYQDIWDTLLSTSGLNYGLSSKGLIKFHGYDSESRTPLEEHLLEAVRYASNGDGTCLVHFTVSAEHRDAYQGLVDLLLKDYEKKWKVRFLIEFSEQKKSLETIAVDLQNQPFRDKAGKLLFRPAGHGALIENLNDLEGDIVFIKNIDNVVHEKWMEPTALWKKLLAGYLLKIQDKIFDYLKSLEMNEVSDVLMNEILLFVRDILGISLPDSFQSGSLRVKTIKLIDALNRPIRVCGVVPNTGEPGGGPFWIRDTRGAVSLQIVEGSQVDPQSEEQQKRFASSTHFNPVDLVCAATDSKGRPFDLRKYVDPEAVFISRKSSEGRELKALELPGLWNGAMARWITLLVEVPLATFNPVKTVFDLAQPTHRA